MLRIKLPHLDRWNAQRRGVAAQYHKIFGDQASLVLPEIVEGHIFHQFTIRVPGGRTDSRPPWPKPVSRP